MDTNFKLADLSTRNIYNGNYNKMHQAIEPDHQSSRSLIQNMMLSIPNHSMDEHHHHLKPTGSFFSHPQPQYPYELGKPDNEISKLIGDLPADAFEPVPIGGNITLSGPAQFDHFPLEKALDQALKSVDDSNHFPNVYNHNTELSKLMLDDLPQESFEPVFINNSNSDDALFPKGRSSHMPSSPLVRKEPPLPTSPDAPLTKRRRTSSVGEPAFRGYQEKQWTKQFDALLKFKEQHGNCLVPHTYPQNQILSRWVKRQRYQYKLKLAGKVSTMTDARIKQLEAVGFVWDSHASTWEKRLEELKEYRDRYGDCNVPSNFPENNELAVWVKCQRRQYKLFWNDNKSSSMTLDRMYALNELGFIWNVREESPWMGIQT